MLMGVTRECDGEEPQAGRTLSPAPSERDAAAELERRPDAAR